MEYHYILHSACRIFVWRCDGLVLDDGILSDALPLRKASQRSNLIVCLDGEIAVQTDRDKKILAKGECLTELRDRIRGVRQEPASLLLGIEWEPGFLGDRVRDPSSSVRLSPSALDRLREAVEPMTTLDGERAEVEAGLKETLAILRAEGAPLNVPSAKDFARDVTPAHRAVGRAIDRTLSSLTERPMLMDIEMGLDRSARQVRRDVSDFLGRYHFNSRGWRDMLQRVRLTTGIALMSAENATTEKVAQLLGYSSPTAFCRIVAGAGLPSPNAIRSRVLSG